MAKKVSFDHCFLPEFRVFHANCCECRIISFNCSTFALGRKSQSYHVQRERDWKRKTVLQPNVDKILKFSFFVHWIAYSVFVKFVVDLK